MKKAIIIGATSGIGKALARLLVQQQYRVGITGRRIELLHALQAEYPDAYIVQSFDVADTNIVEAQLETLKAALGGLDLLILSSGTGDLNDALHFDIEKRTNDTNVNGFTCVADWAFNCFEKQKSGHFVAISSVGGLRGNRKAPAYSASKAYQINYLEGLRQKASRLKLPVYVSDIRPGFVDTDMAKGEGQFWVAPVEKAARQILSAIQRKAPVAYITKRWKLVAWIMKRIPGAIFDRM